MHEVEITPEGLRHLNRLPGKVRAAALEAIVGPIAEAPRRVGKPLVGELAGMYSARRGDYRVIYEIDDEAHTVVILRVQHRRDAYRPREPRPAPSPVDERWEWRDGGAQRPHRRHPRRATTGLHSRTCADCCTWSIGSQWRAEVPGAPGRRFLLPPS